MNTPLKESGNAPILRQLMERHVAEIDALWCRRRLVMTSALHTYTDLHSIDTRLRAHTDALLAGSEHSHALLMRQQVDDDRDAEFAIAFPLLETCDELVRKTFTRRLATAAYPALPGLRDAWMQTSIGKSENDLRQIMLDGSAYNAVCAAEILAVHSALAAPDMPRLIELLKDPNPFVRASAWRLPRYLNQQEPVPGNVLTDEVYRIGTEWANEEDNPAVRKAQLWTAAWCGVNTLQDHLFAPAKSDHLRRELYVALAAPSQWNMVETLLECSGAVERARLIGAYGHAKFIPMLLEDMNQDDVPVCYAAGIAYSKITGTQISSEETALLHSNPAALDSFDQEFLETVFLPDPAAATTHWQKNAQRFSNDTRWHRGFDISRNISADSAAWMDMETRWAAIIRQRMAHKCHGALGQMIKLNSHSLLTAASSGQIPGY